MNIPPIRVAFSTCPNDTFMFAAWANNLIDTENIEIDITLADIKELNQMARFDQVDVCKVSFFAYAFLRHKYVLLDSGSALGHGCGPLLISYKPITIDELPFSTIAIPGLDTTANLLLQNYCQYVAHKRVMLFSDIIPALNRREVDAGVIIHESRFVYQEHGLYPIVDLGDFWEKQTGLPIPLGGIIASKRLDSETVEQLNRILRRSIEYALENPEKVMPYVRQYAQEMDDEVIKAHIELYVNQSTISLDDRGQEAVKQLIEMADSFTLIAGAI
ncbi:MAG: 1,4-dihydroxy-6-naphthoate synthase [Bacteroidia bacterium]|nr:1,4-dihydroxy-6-naphthoate synthase [Bacteroidia bacterium]